MKFSCREKIKIKIDAISVVWIPLILSQAHACLTTRRNTNYVITGMEYFGTSYEIKVFFNKPKPVNALHITTLVKKIQKLSSNKRKIVTDE